MPQDNPSEIYLEPVEQVLRRSLDVDLALHTPVVLKDWERSTVLRCRVQSSTLDVSSLIVKTIGVNESTGFSEWASLAYLTEIGASEGIAPAFYGGDEIGRFYVLEDLGESRSLDDLLTEDNEPTIRAALRALARPMARLVAATVGGDEQFSRIRKGLPAPDIVGREPEAARWLAGRAKIDRWLEALDVDVPAGLDGCMAHVGQVFAEPGPWLAFSHGDPAPTNNHFGNGVARLVDFEYGGFRHAMYDLSAWWVLCPLPRDWVRELNREFQAQLSSSLPAAADDRAFHEAWATMVAFRALAMLIWFPLEAVDDDRSWVDQWSVREALISTALRLHEAVMDVPDLAPAAALGEQLARAAQARWPELGDGRLHWPGATWWR